jgi:hypothetical protein
MVELMKHRNNATTRLDDNDVSSSSSSAISIQTTYQGTPIDELADQLTAMGFDGAMNLILKYGYDRVRNAKARAESRPPGTIRNMAGYIRFLVTSKGAIPAPDQPADKYNQGELQRHVKR